MDQTYNNISMENGKAGSNTKKQVPKNIKQIGRIGEGLKIYVEDYVKTYIKQLTEGELQENPVAVLIGEYHKEEEERSVFIYGAIRINQAWQDNKIIFTEDSWTMIYEKIKKYFSNGEIAGWFVGGSDVNEEQFSMLQLVHLDNFAGRDKLLLYYDLAEKEEQFYHFEEGRLIQNSGYFVYYEKNEEMQEYMIDHKQICREEQNVEDRVVREFRTITAERKPEQQAPKNTVSQPTRRLVYLAGSMLTLVVLAVGITALKNQEKVKGLEDTINTITQALNGKDNLKQEDENKGGNIFELGDNEIIQGGNKTAGQDGTNNGELSVETSGPGITKQPDQDGENSQTDPGDSKGASVTTAPVASATPVVTPTEGKNETSADDPKKNDPDQGKEENKPDDSGGKKAVDTKKNNDNKSNGTEVDNKTNNNPAENQTDQEEKKDKPKDAEETSSKGIIGADVMVYTVKEGDTLAGICYKLYGTIKKLENIKELNQITDENKIYIGQELAVPKVQ